MAHVLSQGLYLGTLTSDKVEVPVNKMAVSMSWGSNCRGPYMQSPIVLCPSSVPLNFGN